MYRSNGNRSSIVSQPGVAATPVSSAAPRYVAELTEFQTVVVDIPPLVNTDLTIFERRQRKGKKR